MTKKRFVLQDLDILCRVLDNGKPINGIETVNLLNALHEENVKLRARNKYLATKIQRERNIHVKEHEKWEEEIQKENEQLKQQMQRLYNYFADWFDDRVPLSDFSEMWDFVKEDKKWD